MSSWILESMKMNEAFLKTSQSGLGGRPLNKQLSLRGGEHILTEMHEVRKGDVVLDP